MFHVERGSSSPPGQVSVQQSGDIAIRAAPVQRVGCPRQGQLCCGAFTGHATFLGPNPATIRLEKECQPQRVGSAGESREGYRSKTRAEHERVWALVLTKC